MSVQVKRPRERGAILALIRERDRHIAALEQALSAKGLPANTRRHLQHNLRGERANRQSWVDYLARKAAA
jgi:hypothetical protein